MHQDYIMCTKELRKNSALKHDFYANIFFISKYLLVRIKIKFKDDN